MNHRDIRSTDELIQWLREKSRPGHDTTSYLNQYLVETVDVLLERNLAPVSVRLRVDLTLSECYTPIGYLLGLSVWEGEQNYSALQMYFPVINGEIVSDLGPVQARR